MNASTSTRCATLIVTTLLLFVGACGDSTTPNRSAPCGDGFCLGTENQLTCPRDCPYECVPGTQRCAGNALLTCRDDGLSESALFCRNDEICTLSGCEPSPGLTPDMSDDAEDAASDTAEDVPDESND
jgi:hypothetical protein